METTCSRRDFARGAAGGIVAALLCTSTAIASEDEASESVSDQKTQDVTVAEVLDYDVVVCGGGAAGINAAAAAAENGVKVVCLEKCNDLLAGGYNYGFINTPYVLEAGGDAIDVMEMADTVVSAHMGACDPILARTFVEANAEVGQWMVDICNQTGHTYELTILHGASMTVFDDALGMMADYTTNLGGDIVFDSGVVQLLTNETGRVTGVVAHDAESDRYVQYNASKGVILATGGIGGNPDMIRKYLPWRDPDALVDAQPNSAQGGENGDAIPLCEAIGARIGDGLFSEQIHFLHGYTPVEGVLFVDQAGQRIPDTQTCLSTDEIRIHEVMNRPGHRTWAIVDDKDGWPEPVNSGAALVPDYDALHATNFDTIDDAASAFGLDVEGLKTTVQAWNDMVASGIDPTYGIDVSSAMSIGTPPYHVAEAKGCIMAIMGGPQINNDLRVIDQDYRPIDGLWAVGNCCSGF